MKKVKGLTKRLAAVLLSGMLVVGAVPGTVLASESPEDIGQTAEITAEDKRYSKTAPAWRTYLLNKGIRIIGRKTECYSIQTRLFLFLIPAG